MSPNPYGKVKPYSDPYGKVQAIKRMLDSAWDNCRKHSYPYLLAPCEWKLGARDKNLLSVYF
ncbi:uncharacterized protein CLUP02_09760 [Colletotrichum lupini]|uniref:Uncharacterized protein n=1 Tax=Colletotrichum lupini TaxID=145971 RepID=A0A9Q8WI49_9PEZI|nr:uncharacterized protein CLUP02_09760 [Colletotrichum lupini]UQC84264.1 hypothetical protein CLUP02_09760 [Colletotrichum lupini]